MAVGSADGRDYPRQPACVAANTFPAIEVNISAAAPVFTSLRIEFFPPRLKRAIAARKEKVSHDTLFFRPYTTTVRQATVQSDAPLPGLNGVHRSFSNNAAIDANIRDCNENRRM